VAGELVALDASTSPDRGEPTLYQVGTKWAGGCRLGAQVNMISNGLTWSPQDLEQAKQAGLCAVAFSVDVSRRSMTSSSPWLIRAGGARH